MDQRQVFLRDVLTILFKRKLLIAAFAAIVFAAVFLGNYVWPPTYESEAKVRLIRGRTTSQTDPSVIQSAAGMIMLQLSREDVYSELDIIYSNDVLREVAEELPQDQGLDTGISVTNMLRNLFHEVEYALALKKRPDPVQETVEALKKAIQAKADDKKYVLDIRCRLGNPEMAQKVLATLLEKYKEKHLEVFANPNSKDFFDTQVKRVADELAAAQTALEQYRNENRIVSLDAEEELLLTQYTEAKKLLVQLAESESAAAKAGEAMADDTIISALSRKTENTVVTELQLRLLELLLERNRITESLGPKHPQVVAIHNQIQNSQKDLLDAVGKTKVQTEAKVTDLESRLQKLNEVKARLEDLERAVRTSSQSLEFYTQKREESIVADAMQKEKMSSIRDIEAASLPLNPVSPRKLLNLIMAAIVGIFGGIALAFFLEYLDHGVKTPEDVEYYFDLPPLASFFQGPYEQLDPTESERLGTMIDAVQTGRPNQLVQVCSSVRREGANRVALALAATRSENPEWRTLLVDLVGDGIEEVPSDRGFMNVLSGECGVDDVLSSMGNLSVLGRGPGNCPAYLWSSDRMQRLLSDLRQRFDRIVFHVAPVLSSHDALNMARFADAVVLVIKSDGTRYEVVSRAVEMLTEAKGRVLGAVLTERKRIIPGPIYRRM